MRNKSLILLDKRDATHGVRAAGHNLCRRLCRRVLRRECLGLSLLQERHVERDGVLLTRGQSKHHN